MQSTNQNRTVPPVIWKKRGPKWNASRGGKPLGSVFQNPDGRFCASESGIACASLDEAKRRLEAHFAKSAKPTSSKPVTAESPSPSKMAN